jgi:ATP-binding cassette, subfamily B, bacterial PglK
MRYILQKIWGLLSKRERVCVVFLIIALAVGAILELVGIGLVMPIIAILSKPELIEQNKYLHLIYTFINPESQQQFILILCFGVIGIYIFKNLFMLMLTNIMSKLITSKSANFASTLFSNYIHAPYAFHLKHNSSTLHKKLDMIEGVFVNTCQSLLIVIADVIVIFFILAMLFYCSPLTTLILFIIFVVVNFSLYMPFKNYNYNIGKSYFKYCKSITQYDLQALRGIKEVIVSNCQQNLSSAYSILQQKKGKVIKRRYVVGQVPRFFIETFVVMAGLGVLIVFIYLGMAYGSILLTLTLLAVSMIRMMPSMSRIQYSLTNIRHQLHAFNNMYEDFKNLSPVKIKSTDKAPLFFMDKIEIKNIDFAYAGTDKNIFTNYSLTIPHAASVAFVGTTGCGKTTLVDIILGLLKPAKGQVCIDGRDIEENLPSWRAKIGYVPQFIFLLDSSIAENVAWGVNKEDIDEERVKECLKKAQILDFVNTLSNKLETNVGENGVSLSGGQRQRIGIARALYCEPEVLVLDEATSALDNETENAFVDALDSLKGKLTIIMIAHRLTTIENCDKIIELK